MAGSLVCGTAIDPHASPLLPSSRLCLPARSFITRHPEALASIMALSGAATIGQLFISHTIKTFGALLFATVMTTRQFISILLSCILFAHPLSGGQWVGTVMVFGEQVPAVAAWLGGRASLRALARCCRAAGAGPWHVCCGPRQGAVAPTDLRACGLPSPAGALYYKSLSRGPPKPKAVDGAPNGEAAAADEKLPLVHATVGAPEAAAAVPEETLK